MKYKALVYGFLLYFFASPAFVLAQTTSNSLKLTPTPTPLTVPSQPPSGIDLTLSPTYLSLTTDPGKEVTSQFRITNNNAYTEYLELQVAKFTASANGSNPVIADMKPSDTFAQWIHFSETQFTIDPNQNKIINVTIDPPSDAALGYYYAVLVKRISNQKGGSSQAVVSGSPAISVLLNVKSPTAKRELQVVDFRTDQLIYEYLPTTFEVKVKNTGNIHVVPVGDIFIDSVFTQGKVQNGSQKPLVVLPINEGLGNVLPGTVRTFPVTWNDGFIVRVPKMENGKEVKDAKGNTVLTPSYNFQKADKFRIGKYTAHLLLAYDNGERDVPLEATVSFWVIPWKILLGVGVIILLVLFGLKSMLSGIIHTVKK